VAAERGMDSAIAARKASLARALRRVLPADAVLESPEELRPYECDGLSMHRTVPLLAVLPADESQVREVLRVCYASRAPVVARGSGTGLSGGATPIADGVLLSLAKLNRILEVDPTARTARVQPGVRNLAISEAAAPYGLYYAPDPSSQIACSIGGNVAENSGGVHCLKYGLTVHNLRRMRVLTIDGELLELGSESLDGQGYDLMALLTGSEGLLGVVTEVTVQLLPRPEQARVVMAAFDEVVKAGAAVADVIAAGIVPAGLEMMDGAAIRAAESFVHAGYPTDAAAILLCESDGMAEDVAHEIAQVEAIFSRHGATAVRVSDDEAERLRLWAGRKAAFPAVGRIAPDYYCMDGTIPRQHLAMVLKRIDALSQRFGLACANVFHAGDGNLHPLVLFDDMVPGEQEKAEILSGKILDLCIEHGGSITGEHGVGVDKSRYMPRMFGADDLDTMQLLRCAFDPGGLCNPGKVFPTPRLCGEVPGVRHAPHPLVASGLIDQF